MTRRLLSIVGAGGLIVGGYVHLCLYRHGYRFVPVIGTLFLVNFLSSAAVAIGVLVMRRLVTELAGIGVAVGTLGAFVASRLPGGIFHFQERGFLPAPQSAIAVVAELVAIAMLVAAIAGDRRAGRETHVLSRAPDGHTV